MSSKISKIISSSKRDKTLYPEPSSYRYPVALPSSMRAIKLRNFSIPNSIYNINATNNELFLIAEFYEGEPDRYVVPPGNYTPNALAAAINDLIGESATFTYNAITGRMTFNVAGQLAMHLSGSLLGPLGFREMDVTYAGYPGEFVYEMVGTRVVNLAQTAVIYLRLNGLSTSDSTLGEVGLIYNDVAFGDILTGNTLAAPPIEWNGMAPALTEFEISFVDEAGRLVDFNGADHTLEFELTLAIQC